MKNFVIVFVRDSPSFSLYQEGMLSLIKPVHIYLQNSCKIFESSRMSSIQNV